MRAGEKTFAAPSSAEAEGAFDDATAAFDPSCSLTIESIQAWRREVEGFFASDWASLRTLIRRLEEELWCGAPSTPAPKAVSPMSRTEPLFDLVAAEMAQLARKSADPAASAAETSRLLELSRKLDEQIRSSSEGRDAE